MSGRTKRSLAAVRFAVADDEAIAANRIQPKLPRCWMELCEGLSVPRR